MASSKLVKYISNLGYGTRREVAAMFEAGQITFANGTIAHTTDVIKHDDIRIDGAPVDVPPGSVIMLNKPTGYVCSTNDVPPLIYDLLPPRFLRRTPVIASVGRLDRDTSGLLLLTDDGSINHLLTSPRRHLPRVYDVTLAEAVSGDEVVLFASGTLILESDVVPLAPAELVVTGERTATITLHEGRYHQVRRMFAATGNHVNSLHRVSFGGVELGDLPSGKWRELSNEEVTSLTSAPRR